VIELLERGWIRVIKDQQFVEEGKRGNTQGERVILCEENHEAGYRSWNDGTDEKNVLISHLSEAS